MLLKLAMSEIINSQQAAELLGIKQRTLRKWVKNNKIPYVRYSVHNIRFNVTDLLEWQELKSFTPEAIQEQKTVRQQKKLKTELSYKIENMLAKHYGNKKK
jgi:excisionase family DNA binding protein